LVRTDIFNPVPDAKGMDTVKTPIVQERPLATARPWLVCGISRAQWFKLAASGRTPLPVRLGTRRPVYLIEELESWLRAGAPDRASWERMRGAPR
jgi:predicted DNA-binding transcriptional regulator AlpA